jgi:hypothetical protein
MQDTKKELEKRGMLSCPLIETNECQARYMVAEFLTIKLEIVLTVT